MNEYIYTIRDIRRGPGSALEILDWNGNKVEGDSLVWLLKRLDALRPTFVYLACGYNPDLKRRCHKIGLSMNPRKRLAKLRFDILHTIPCDRKYRIWYEKLAHCHFIDRCKWLGGEYFNLTDDDVKWFCSLDSMQEFTRIDALSYSYAMLEFQKATREELKDLHDDAVEAGFTTLSEYQSKVLSPAMFAAWNTDR